MENFIFVQCTFNYCNIKTRNRKNFNFKDFRKISEMIKFRGCVRN